jgi:hypothetical protein
LFVASVAGLAAGVGILAVSTGAPQAIDTAQSAAAHEPPGQRVVAEIPIQEADSQNTATIVRFVTPRQNASQADLRTRATP